MMFRFNQITVKDNRSYRHRIISNIHSVSTPQDHTYIATYKPTSIIQGKNSPPPVYSLLKYLFIHPERNYTRDNLPRNEAVLYSEDGFGSSCWPE